MPRAYADMSALISQKLQDTTPTEFTAASINFQIEECLKEISARQPHIVPVVFNIESRHGQATSTSTSNLVDATKAQFLATDPTDEKVVYNYTDHTWATIISQSSTSQVGLSADIMASGDTYFIFNKRCRNNKQLYMGGSFDPYTAIRAEYPCNCWPRNWRNVKVIEQDILELILDIEPDDSDSTLSNLGRTEVLVEFKRPHVLSQLTDWVGELTADAVAGATTINVDGLGASETIEEGEEFHLENHRTLYTVTADTTLTSGGVGTSLAFFPGLEAASSDNDDITFVKSTLSPTLEGILADLCVGYLLVDQAPKYFKTIGAGGNKQWQTLLDMGERKLGIALARLSRDTPRITKRSYHSE